MMSSGWKHLADRQSRSVHSTGDTSIMPLRELTHTRSQTQATLVWCGAHFSTTRHNSGATKKPGAENSPRNLLTDDTIGIYKGL